ncbi:MAG: iron ABC transporter permease, partial [Desulfohalobiaceae bacterium]|nr:iron ABC transporter permease [Desulfohalobiaceae bacterium]
MHFDDGRIPEEYTRYIGRKSVFVLFLSLAMLALVLAAVSLGSADIPFLTVLKSFFRNSGNARLEIIVWNIRLPQALAAVTAGAGLAVSGAVMQSILRNPLGSPFTLGISHAAAFGAAFSVMILGSGIMSGTQAGDPAVTNIYLTTLSAFCFSLAAAGVIMGVSRIRGASPEVMILTGVALGALFTAGTMFLQYFADDVQLAAMVFWTFGDTARASWFELGLITGLTVLVAAYFMANSWNYNAIDAGDETARGLGVHVQRVRLLGMLAATLLTAVI